MSAKYTGIPDTFAEDARNLTNLDLCEKYDKSERTIQRWRQAVKVPALYVVGRHDTPHSVYTFPDPGATDYAETGYLKIEGDCVVTSDWHAPYHDLKLAENMLRVAEKQGIEQLAIVGDLFDAHSLSFFDPRDIEFSVRDEFATTVHILEKLFRHFKVVYWSGGNHEARFFRSVKFQLELPELGEYLSAKNEKLVTTERDVMLLESEGREYRLTHPRSYSQSSCAVAVKLAEKHDQNVMSAHGHFMGWRVSRNGKFLGIDLGGLFDTNKIVYLNVGGETTHPVWNGGFWIVRNGVPTPYSNLLTDWSLYESRPVFQVIQGGKAA